MLTYPDFAFDITYRDPASRARLGTLKTPHGTINTPNFIFCGTKAAIKSLSPAQMREAQTDIILANTYHLMGAADTIEAAGGLHKFTGWNGPMMTDSGGYQIFAMGHGGVADEIKGRNRKIEKSLLKVTEEGATFKISNGDVVTLTAEMSIQIQRKLGADLIYQFDECTPYNVEEAYTRESMYRSHRWGERSLVEFERTDNGMQALYGIVQGGVYKDLRDESCAWTKEKPFFGTAIGGCLGGSKEEFYEITGWCMPQIHQDRPVHLLGIGMIRDIFQCVRLGIDTFDCVHPTRLARHGTALMKGVGERTQINMKNAQFRNDHSPLDANSPLAASREFSKAYVHHLIREKESLGIQILAQHNVSVMNQLMREIRAAVSAGSLDSLEKEWISA